MRLETGRKKRSKDRMIIGSLPGPELVMNRSSTRGPATPELIRRKGIDRCYIIFLHRDVLNFYWGIARIAVQSKINSHSSDLVINGISLSLKKIIYPKPQSSHKDLVFIYKTQIIPAGSQIAESKDKKYWTNPEPILNLLKKLRHPKCLIRVCKIYFLC